MCVQGNSKKADNKKTVYFKLTKEGIVAYNNHEKFHADKAKKASRQQKRHQPKDAKLDE